MSKTPYQDSLIKRIKKKCIGFPCVAQVYKHYTEADTRISFIHENGKPCTFYLKNDKIIKQYPKNSIEEI